MDLSWMLAGVLHGWAARRDPRCVRSRASADHRAGVALRDEHGVGVDAGAGGGAGEHRGRRGRKATRCARRFGRAMYELNVPQFCCGGLNFGYFYDRSPIIAYDGETPPPYTMDDFTPSTVPGCRVPHVWLRDGRSLYDAMGPASRCCASIGPFDVMPLIGAAAERGVPLAVLDVRLRRSRRALSAQARAVAPRPARRLARRCAARRSARADRPGPRWPRRRRRA